ncbi:AtMMH-1 [Rhodocollybia butyracea]|uniref:AtMMH-1 n=1 Tax=Rhodocollybia butyracea TaxID=206335 RepID=A0A9P5Q334_9AGAR|nr:AtMMH-1 [Rhodocollybia butyracea]
MPELPEVERAVRMIRRIGLGRTIKRVETTEDSIVFSETTHTAFIKELTGRKITGVKRYGKSFYLELDGNGKLPVFHFGMTGMLQVKGELAAYYKETPKSASTDWPPRFMKFILQLTDDNTKESTEIAFMDARRLGKIRLRDSPATEPPISELGFDPILSMPSLDTFKPLVLKRSCPVKALLLDQTFSAGVGNWVADEILYHSHVHPEQRCNTLTADQLESLHHCTKFVCETAVSVDADDMKFPDDWLFKHRWGKGKKANTEPLRLASGEPATIKWITVGGRTSAYVEELQQMSNQVSTPSRKKRSTRASSQLEVDNVNDRPTLTDSETEVLSLPAKKQRKAEKGSKLKRKQN